jgi:hypothetical protein
MQISGATLTYVGARKDDSRRRVRLLGRPQQSEHYIGDKGGAHISLFTLTLRALLSGANRKRAFSPTLRASEDSADLSMFSGLIITRHNLNQKPHLSNELINRCIAFHQITSLKHPVCFQGGRHVKRSSEYN